MHRNKQYQRPINKTPQCCFIQFFSQSNTLQTHHHKSKNGLINPYKTHQSIHDQRQIIFQTKKLKTQFIPQKRSISRMKIKKRQSNRISQETYNNQNANKQIQSNELMIQKIKSPLKGSEVVQRYYSPRPHTNPTMSTSQLEDKKKIDAYFNCQNIKNKIQFQPDKSNTFFKQQKAFQPIQFTRNTKQSNLQATSIISKNNLKVNFPKYERIQSPQQNNLMKSVNKINNIDIKLQKIVYFQQPSLFQNAPLNYERIQRPQNKQNMQQKNIKKDNPQQITINCKGKQSLKQSLKLKRSTLQNIQQLSKQQSRQQGYFLQMPINPFQHIESFVQIKRQKLHSFDDNQKQYDSIKTKGRPVQSMMQMTKDMTKTKKHTKHGKKQAENGLHDMDNMTVTSQFDEDSQRDRVQRIEQSTVLLNFFNPSTNMRDRLELSRANKLSQMHQKSGFYK